MDASFQPSQGATNPTLTIIANAIRVGEHLRQAWFNEASVSLKDYPLSEGYMADSAAAELAVPNYVAGDGASWGA